jgi:hypothetical protein
LPAALLIFVLMLFSMMLFIGAGPHRVIAVGPAID